MRVIGAGPSEVVSFNDVGSPDGRLTSGLKVHIDAQVLRGENLDWYYRLLHLCPGIPGELKSAVVTEKYWALPIWGRLQILATLYKVRLHITDPRPYQGRIDELSRSLLKRDDAPEVIRQRASEGDIWARNLQALDQRFVAESVLRDSAPARAHRMAEFFDNEMFLLTDYEFFEPPELVTVEDFHCKPKAIVKKTTEWAVKAAAAFHRCNDVLDPDPDQFLARFRPGHYFRERMIVPLLDGHGFDKGDEQQIRVLEQTRDRLMESLIAHDPLGRRMLLKPVNHVEVESSGSLFGQAADVAAGIASSYFMREGLPAVVANFEYVTYNGRRIGLTEAEEIVRQEQNRNYW